MERGNKMAELKKSRDKEAQRLKAENKLLKEKFEKIQAIASDAITGRYHHRNHFRMIIEYCEIAIKDGE